MSNQISTTISLKSACALFLEASGDAELEAVLYSELGANLYYKARQKAECETWFKGGQYRDEAPRSFFDDSPTGELIEMYKY